MAMQLFEHNKTAYEAAVKMLAERGKAAVIHPTGTGKSFIGFKLCEDNPDKTICWLSPSRYIYQTQLENLAETSGGHQPDNVKFYTYAKLVNVAEAEIAEIQPDYIIHDQPKTLVMPEIPNGSFEKKLYSMYLSYLPRTKPEGNIIICAE